MSWHSLQLSYEQFRSNGKSIADSKIDKYIVYQKIGKGAYGSVYRGMSDQTKKQVAIKVLDLLAIQKQETSPKIKQIRRRLAKTESQLMMKVNSNHVMKLYDVYQNKQLKLMVLEYCNGGTLSEQIENKRRIPQVEAIQIIKQIIFGLAAMHKENIIHRDLKTQNIMSHNGVYKIVDLGFARLIPKQEQILGTVLGSIITMAPQVMRKEKYGLKADIWSIGIILYEMIYGNLPYQVMKNEKMYDQIINKNIFPNNGLIDGIKPSKGLLDVLQKMIVVDHHKRLSWEQLIKQPIFKNKYLPDKYRFTVNLDQLKDNNGKVHQRIQDDIIQKVQKQINLQQKYRKIGKVIPLSQKQKQRKRNQIDYSEGNFLQWAIQNHLQCLKTQLIYNQIITPIQQNKMLNLSSRKVIQLMYMLSQRCFFNMSFIKNDFVDSYNPVVTNLKNIVQKLYSHVIEKFQLYSKLLTQQQNKVISIVQDRFDKIFKAQSLRKKDKFLTGLETIEFTKDQHIQYTYKKFISKLVNDIQPKNAPVVFILKKYKQINHITIKQLKMKKFYERVQQIIGEQESNRKV